MLVDIAVLALRGISHDAPRDGPGHLPHQDLLPVRRLDDDRSPLVLGAGLRKPGLHEISLLVEHRLDTAVHRIPVGMDIRDAHENGDHQPPVMEIFTLVHLFQHHNPPVGRGYHRAFRRTVENADGTTEKIEHPPVEDNAARQQDCRDVHIAHQAGYQHIQQQQREKSYHKDVGTFTMNPYLLQLLQLAHSRGVGFLIAYF